MTIPPQIALFQDPDDKDDLFFEREYWNAGHLVAGVDEAGRGCLAGPVVAAAVVLPENVRIEGVTDSKVLSALKRQKLAKQIKATALSWSIGSCNPKEIDQLNILWASMEAMRRAIEALDMGPGFVLIDGNTSIPGLSIPSKPIIKGDSKSHTIAAASILAKTHRDDLMNSYHQTYPTYSWNTNAGYPTAAHYEAIRLHGVTDLHRSSFKLYR
ncbi:MAG: ribonuclease HII [Rhodothermales bacterium]|nr:ribonuclease HII [Rhodothermales bacterium]MDG2015872.1 ribonuclease HII [Rhodothermales bacterium]